MHDYGVRDVERLLGLSRSAIRSLVSAGFVSPSRGARNSWRFSFQDLIVLRTAQALADAQVPQRRITRSVKELRRHLPETMPLSGLSICAVADRVVVREGASRWQAESGQYLLEFEADPTSGALNVVEGAVPAAARDSQEWINRGIDLERENPVKAIEAYQHAIAIDPSRLDARINLGRLLHETRRYAKADEVYRAALRACGNDALLLFNHGVLLDDMDRKAAAMQAYAAALREDATFADCHYNLALLYQKAGKTKEAIRHLSQYRKLAGSKSK